jgi:hypothetical protein
MRKEYDFSKGEKGKFYRPDIKLNIPIYLDEEVSAFVDKIASKKRIDPCAFGDKNGIYVINLLWFKVF